MPVRTYMVVAPRHDHSFRVPRPDLSATLGVPNACNDCHKDQTPAWAAASIERWHGPDRKGHQNYAPAFHAARTGKPEARALLQKVAEDPDTPAIARATSLTLLQRRQSTDVQRLFQRSLSDPDPMVRMAALGGLEGLPLEQRWRHAVPALADPVRVVRIEAANLLADGPAPGAAQPARDAFAAATAELIASLRYNADRPEARSSLGRLYARQGRLREAEDEYLAALRLDSSISPRVDLADLYRSLGREAEAEALLRQTIQMAPTAAAAHHALGLAMVRAKRHGEALASLKQATELDPAMARYAYVYAVALQSAGQSAESLRILEEALKASPSDTAILSLLLQNALKSGEAERALQYAERLQVLLPDDRTVASLARQLRAGLERLRKN
jgi:tetratricopeptide (TPR) repeat protein